MAALQTEELYDDILGSVLRALSGFLMSVALIVPLGLGVGWCARLGNLLISSPRSARTPHRSRYCLSSSCFWTFASSQDHDVIYVYIQLRLVAPAQHDRGGEADRAAPDHVGADDARDAQQLSAVILPAALPTIVVGIRLASASVIACSSHPVPKGYFIINTQYSL